MSESIDLALGVLDHQLVDSDGRRCGKVDDLELEGIGEGSPRVTAIVVGPPAWKNRGFLGGLASRITRGRSVLVPWDEVEKIDAAIHLRRPARELRLGGGDRRAARFFGGEG